MMFRYLALSLLFWLQSAHAADDEGATGITAALAAIVSGIQKVVDKLDGFIDWLFDLWKSYWKSLLTLLKDFFLWIMEQLLALAKTAMDGMTGFDSIIAAAASTWSAIPPEVVAVLQAIGLGTALGLIAAAILIRLALQLIPFVRLGS